MTKTSRILTGAAASVFAFGAVAFSVAPTYANDGAFQQVTVTTAEEIILTGDPSGNTVLEPSATGGADVEAAGQLKVEANVAWKLQWQAVTGTELSNEALLCTDAYDGTAVPQVGTGGADGICDTDGVTPVHPHNVTPAGGTALTKETSPGVGGGFGVYAAGTNIKYQGTNAVASSTTENVWSAQLVPSDGTGAATTFNFVPLSPALTKIWNGPATNTAILSPTYSADIDASLPSGTYTGTIYYVLTADS